MAFFYRRGFSNLLAKIDESCGPLKSRFNIIKKEHGNVPMGSYTVGSALTGMRGIKGLLTETSELDAQEGIRFRGWSIPQIEAEFPAREDQPLPEGLFSLMLTGEKPTMEEVNEISADLYERAQKLPASVEKVIRELPIDLHPMTMLSIGVMTLQEQSQFFKEYASKTLRKVDYWKPIYEDAMDLIAQIPTIGALIYRIKYADGRLPDMDSSLDWSGNYAKMLGCSDEPLFAELMRLYLTIHTDHEGGNGSAHTCHLVGSALSDPYLSYSAGINALAGPLHGAANAECLRFLLAVQKEYGDTPSSEDVRNFVQNQLNSGQVIPGYGHAVLKQTDPRFVSQMGFAEKYLGDDNMCKLVKICYDEIPKILKATGKVANPWPNVDAHSGALLSHFGLNQFEYFTVLFAISRSMGSMAQLIHARYLGAPLERPKSVTFEALEAAIAKSS